MDRSPHGKWASGLKSGPERADRKLMRFERLVIEAEDNTFSLEFHPRLTVISGVGRLEREGLTTELVGALSASRAGVHAEVMADTGNRFAIFRPFGARHRVVDIDTATDVSTRFADDTGVIDLLAVAGLDRRTAKRRLRLTASDLTTSTHHEQIVRRLAGINPAELWGAVEEVAKAQIVVDEAAEAAGSAPEDVEVVEQIERRHNEFEAVQSVAEKFRRASFFAGAFAALAAVPSAMLLGRAVAMAFVIGAAIVTGVSFMQNQRMIKARKAEEEALAEAGAKTYLGFHLQRVNSLLDSESARHRLMEASADLEQAQGTWTTIAGDVAADWVIEYKSEIQEATERRRVIEATSTTASGEASSTDEATALADALVARLTTVRNIGPADESLPLILDDALNGLDTSLKAPLLELLVRSSESQQIVFMTEDPDVTEWARLEAMTGAVAILEPSPDDTPATIEDRSLSTG